MKQSGIDPFVGNLLKSDIIGFDAIPSGLPRLAVVQLKTCPLELIVNGFDLLDQPITYAIPIGSRLLCYSGNLLGFLICFSSSPVSRGRSGLKLAYNSF
ncbi:MAG: hypothetical protein BGO57_13250 [Sphingomonadales bacterium 63-6]|nr:MAG: hypothetical protein BGO57_13250 [Sphingomonadales bacterium 63-6]